MCLEKYLVEQCAPTLASLKTGTLFGVFEDDEAELARQVRKWQLELASKGLVLTTLRYRNGRALIYLGRLSQLERDLSLPGAGALLRSCGYETGGAVSVLDKLSERLGADGSFPHEIGLFLGYPLPDVLGFIRYGGKTASLPATGRSTETSVTQSDASLHTANAVRYICACGRKDAASASWL